MDALRPIDIAVLTGLLAWPEAESWSIAALAERLHIPSTSLYRSLGRLSGARLLSDGRAVQVVGAVELLVHGVRWVFPAALGPPSRGLPTAHAGPGLVEHLKAGEPWVWADESGAAFGVTVEPLHPSVPRAAAASPELYRLASIVEALRVGRARDRALAEHLLREELGVRP